MPRYWLALCAMTAGAVNAPFAANLREGRFRPAEELRALYERGIVPDLLVGTSAGALNAAFVASRPQTAATAAES